MSQRVSWITAGTSVGHWPLRLASDQQAVWRSGHPSHSASLPLVSQYSPPCQACLPVKSKQPADLQEEEDLRTTAQTLLGFPSSDLGV